jgi:hypothetical protein
MFFATQSDPWTNYNVTAAVLWSLVGVGGGIPPLLIIVTMLI